MNTTIQISQEVKEGLNKIRIYKKESYNDIIEWILEDYKELNDKTKKEIEEARKEIKKGNFYTQEEIETMYGVS